MAQGPENRFIAKVHRRLSEKVYREKMHNAYRGGTPDVWYSGRSGDMWVEYKWVDKLPKSGTIVPGLSALQLKWLEERFYEGRNVAVVVGCPDGAFLMTTPGEWKDGVDPSEFVLAEDIVAYIEERCL